MTHGFLIFTPVKSMIAKLELKERELASSFNPTSSVMSLFLDKFKLMMPLLWPSSFAKETKPLSENTFLLKSRTYKVELSFRNPLKASNPVLLILFRLKHSSSSVLLTLRASTNSLTPPSRIKF